MIECPNCGTPNTEGRAFCQICGEKLPAPPAASAPGADEAMIDWLLEEPEGDPEPSPPPPAPQEAAPSAAEPSTLPEWLRDLPVQAEVAAPAEVGDWDDALDFSELPDWEEPDEEPPAGPRDAAGRQPKVVRVGRRPPPDGANPIQGGESLGSGLLAGIQAPIPVEPVITIQHRAPAFPTRAEVERDDEAANLFARIAGGAILMDPVTLPERHTRSARLLNLLLLLAILVPLLLGPGLLGPPAPLPAAVQYWETLEALPAGSSVLLAFEYQGALSEELTPAVIDTLVHLQAVEGMPRLITVSTTPQGNALAGIALQAAGMDEGLVQRCTYLPGGAIALRALLAGQGRVELGTGCRLEAAPDLLLVIGNEANDVQGWIEQAALVAPGTPLAAIVPTAAEPSLAPYLASGQLIGLLSGVPGAASYEFYGLRTDEGLAWRRLDATTLAALLFLVAIVAGNLVRRRGA